MDNYFTLPGIIKKLRDKGVGIVGTARFRQNLPSKELKALTVERMNFNEFHYCYKRYRTLIARWMDNNLVFCVSTYHTIGKVIKRMRRRSIAYWMDNNLIFCLSTYDTIGNIIKRIRRRSRKMQTNK